MISNNKKIFQLLIVLTMIPFLSSCQLVSNNLFLKQIALYIGNVLADTVTGKAIERILDDVLGKVSTKSSNSIAGYVIPNFPNSSGGKYSTTLKLVGKKLTNNQESNQIIELNIDTPRMVLKNRKLSEWELAPDLKQLIKQVFERQFGEKVITPHPEEITVGSIIPDDSNSLEGIYSKTMKISGYDKSGQKVEFFIDKPRMVRQHKDDQNWMLTTDLKQVLNQVIKNSN